MTDLRCPRCGWRMRTLPNPYYGKGLAVHRFVTVCDDCGFTGLRGRSRSWVAEAEEERPAPPEKQGILSRVLSVLHGPSRET